MTTAISTFAQIRARGGHGPATSAMCWLVPTAPFEPFRDCGPTYRGVAEFHAALFQAGFELLEAKQTLLADVGLMARIRRSR